MSTKIATDKPYSCSFCGKWQHEVQKLIAGPGNFICEECVWLCASILLEEGKQITGYGSDEMRALFSQLPQATKAAVLATEPPMPESPEPPTDFPSDYAFSMAMNAANAEFQKAQSRIVELEGALNAKARS